MQFEVKTKLTKEVDAECGKKLRKGLKICWIAGLVGLIANILISCIVYLDAEKDPLWLEIELYASAVLFAVGLVFTLTLSSMEKKGQKYTLNAVNAYTFFDHYVQTTSYRGEDKIAEVKNYYTEITKIRKTEHYVFLYLGLRGAYPVEIAALTQEQLDFLLTIKKRPQTPLIIAEGKGQPKEDEVHTQEERNE